MIIIPARIGSSRFPNKVLADIKGIPMVIRTAQAVQSIDRVVIATDAQEVIEIAKTYKLEAVITKESHQSGTDRIYEVVEKLGLKDDEVVINVQGDEPFIESEVVQAIHTLTTRNATHSDILMNSCYKAISHPEADDPNMVKVVTDEHDIACYFSRAKIPYPRDHHFDGYKGHLGIYGFTVKALRTFCTLPTTALEEIEKLEQLRALAHGYKVAMVEVETQSFGIDTPEDLERALSIYSLSPHQC